MKQPMKNIHCTERNTCPGWQKPYAIWWPPGPWRGSCVLILLGSGETTKDQPVHKSTEHQILRLTRMLMTASDYESSVNRVLRGWCNYFRHGVSARTFSYLDHFTWWRIFGWLRKRHAGLNKGTLVRRHLPNWVIRDGPVEMFRPQKIAIVRYRYRGAQIPTPWASATQDSPAPAA